MRGKNSSARIAYASQFLALLFLLFTTFTAHAGIDQWTSTGPGGGNFLAIAVAPSNPDIVYAGTYGTVFKSTNGGQLWTVANNTFLEGSPPKVIAVDPQNPDLVYAGVGHLYLSRDGGTTWNISLDIARIGTVAALVFDPLDHNIVYAGGNGIWKSTDAGASWVKLTSLFSAPLAIYHANAAQPAILYAMSSTGFTKSTDGGVTWSASVTVGSGIVSLAVDPTNPDVVYASNRELYRSTDGGATWTTIYAGSNSNFFVNNLLILPQQPNVLYATGSTFQKFTIETNGEVKHTIFRISHSVNSFALNPQQPTAKYVGTAGYGIFKKSVDDDDTPWSESNTGIANLKVDDLALDPQEPTNLYAVAPTAGSAKILTSADRGENWRSFDKDLSLNGFATRVVVSRVDLAQSARIYLRGSGSVCATVATSSPPAWICTVIVGGSNTLALDPASGPGGADVLYADGNTGVRKSIDSGANWVNKNLGLADTNGALPSIQKIVTDPQSPTTLYAIGLLGSLTQHFLYKSTDGAEHWSVVNFPAGVHPYTLAVDPHDSDTLYVGVVLGVSRGIYKSTDGGNTWTPKNTGLTDALSPFAIGVIAIDPQLPTTLYVGTLSTSSKGIFKSIDGGEHWTPLNTGLPASAHYPFALVVDPQDTARVYAGTPQHGVMWIQQTLTVDLAVSKTDDPDPATVGKPLTYTITVTNHGPDPATGVAITENLPSGMTLVSITPSQGTCGQPSALSCQLGALLKDASATITVVVTPTTPGIVNNSVTVTAAVTDPNPDNNTATAVTEVELDRVDHDGDGYSKFTGDCNDNREDPAAATIHPGAVEICNGKDDDCDFAVPANEADSDSDGTWNCNDACPADPLKTAAGLCGCGVADTDTDHDGTLDCNDQCPNDPLKTAAGLCGCGVADTDTDHDGTPDCNDQCPNDPTRTVSSPEICNGIDDNCNGQTDEGVKSTFYRDADGDSYGDPLSTVQACSAPPGYVANGSDCDDTRNTVRPGAGEICGDGIDNNCDGVEGQCRLVGLEVTQSVQDWKNSVPLVQRKTTYVRANFELVGLDRMFMRSHLRGDRLTSNGEVPVGFLGKEATLRCPGASPCDVTDRRSTLNGTVNFLLPPEWTAGKLRLKFGSLFPNIICDEAAEAGGAAGDCEVTVQFSPVRTMKVKFIATQWKEPGKAGKIHRAGPGEFKELRERLRAQFPIQDVDMTEGFLDIGEVAQTTEERDGKLVQLFNGKTAPEFKTGHKSTIEALRAQECEQSLDNCERLYYGVLLDLNIGGIAIDIPSRAALGGMLQYDTFGYSRSTHAHELAHDLGRFHAPYCRADTPPGTTFPFTETIGGVVVPTIGPMNKGHDDMIFGLDTYGGGTLRVADPRQNFEIMGYCGNNNVGSLGSQFRWPSSFTYNALRDAITNFAPAEAEIAAHSKRSIRIVLPPYILLPTGEIAGAFVLPIYSSDSSIASAPPEPGDYTLQLRDAAGGVLQEISFQPSEAHEDVPEGEVPGNEPLGGFFQIAVPDDESVKQVRVLYQGTEIGSRSASSNAPQVTVVSPNGGENLNGETVKIEWTGSDADSDPLSYLVQYSRNNGASWETLAVDWPETTLTVPLSALAGSTQGRIQVIASDGFNSTSDQSDSVFTVANHAPEVYTLSPEDGRLFLVNEAIVLKAVASDKEDGTLSDDSIVWISSLDGALGTGTDFSAPTLSEGEHEITITATDSAGSSASTSVHIRVVAALPNVLSDLSVAQTINANIVSVSDAVTFTVTATNDGPNPATEVTLHVAFTGGVAGLVATPSQGNCTVTGKIVSCMLGAITDRESATVAFSALATAAGEMTHTATVSGNEVDPALADNTDTQTVLVNEATPVEICGNCADDDGDGTIDAADTDCPAATMTKERASFTLASAPQSDQLTLTAILPGTPTLDPPLDGVKVQFLDVTGILLCLELPPATVAPRAWSTKVSGTGATTWKFKDAADGHFGAPSKDKGSVTYDPTKNTTTVKLTLKQAEIGGNTTAREITTGIMIGDDFWKKAQMWKPKAKGKKLATP